MSTRGLSESEIESRLLEKDKEGYKNEKIPKLEVFRREIGKTFLHKDDTNIFAIASDEKLNTDIPSLDLNNISSITDLLIKKFEIA